MVLCEFYPKPKCPLPFPLPPELKCRLCPWAACTFAKGGRGNGRGHSPLPPPKVKKAQKPKIQQNAIVSPCFLSAKKKKLRMSIARVVSQCCFSIVVSLLDQYWTSTGAVLDQYWGQYWGQYWVSTGPVLDQYWTSTGAVLGQCCISTGASTESVLGAVLGTVLGPVLGSVLDQYWTSSGVSTVAVLWQYCGSSGVGTTAVL